MYQTVGHEALELLGQALELPLYRHKIAGKAEQCGKAYMYTEHDEVEDLFRLLRDVQVSAINNARTHFYLKKSQVV